MWMTKDHRTRSASAGIASDFFRASVLAPAFPIFASLKNKKNKKKENMASFAKPCDCNLKKVCVISSPCGMCGANVCWKSIHGVSIDGKFYCVECIKSKLPKEDKTLKRKRDADDFCDLCQEPMMREDRVYIDVDKQWHCCPECDKRIELFCEMSKIERVQKRQK